MKCCLKCPNKSTLLVLMVSLSVIPLAMFLFLGFGVLFTYTGSIPIGFYRIAANSRAIQRGDIISFCLPNAVAEMGLKRGYLFHGRCANGSEALIKQVIAVPGDTVTLAPHQLIVNHVNRRLNYFAPTRVMDKARLPVYRFIQNGTYLAKGYWVYGYGNPRYSWDSRYYGEIPKANIKHRLVPLWQF